MWGNSAYAPRLFVMQKKALRILGKASFNPCADFYYKDSCKPHFRQLNIMTLPCIYMYLTILFVVENNYLVIDNREIHQHFTRGNKNIHITKNKLKMTDNCPIYAGSLFYNKLPVELKNLKDCTFKNCLKQYFLAKCYYKVNEFLYDKENEFIPKN